MPTYIYVLDACSTNAWKVYHFASCSPADRGPLESTVMAQFESVSKMGDRSVTLHSSEKKSVARLLKDNPYMGGVAIVSLCS